MFNAIYKFPAYRFVCDGIFTTKTPTDAYRGAGRPEATFAIERIMDELAVELGMDPMELRRKNWIKHEEFPFTTVCGLTYDSGNYEAATDKALELIGWDELRAEQKRAPRAQRPGAARPRHLDVHRDVRPGAVAGARLAGLRRRRLGARVDPHARHRQGRGRHRLERRTARATRRRSARSSPTSSACRSRTSRSSTATPQSSPKGLDTYGSRSLAVGGIAIVKAAEKVVEKAEDDRRAPARGERGRPGVRRRLVLGEGLARLVGRASSEIAFADVRWRTTCPTASSRSSTPTPPTTRRTSPSRTARTCAPSRSTPRPAASTIRKYVCVDDVGTPINPLIVEGQVHGGLAQGIAQALYEEAVYDDDGNLTTGTFVDYLLPSAADLPSFTTDRTETPSTSNPLGVKGVGEAGTIASTPAVVNAVVDALRPLRRQRHPDAGHARTGLAGDPQAPDEVRSGRGRAPSPTAAPVPAPRTEATA